MAIRTAGQFEYFANRGRQRAGLMYNDSADRIFSYVNGSGQVQQVHTITATSGSDVSVYVVTIAGISARYTSAAGNTANDIAAGIAAAIQRDAVLNGIVDSSASTNTVVLTTLLAGDDLDIDVSVSSGTGSLAIVQTTAPSDSASLPFGRGVIGDPSVDRGVRLPLAANLIARQVDLTPTAVNNAIYTITIDVAGASYPVQFTAGGSATAAEIVDGLVAIINRILPANTVLAANDSDNLRLTAEVAGQGFEYAAGSNNSGATWAVAADNNARNADINSALLGVSGLTDSVEALTIGSDDAAYPSQFGYNVNVLREGLLAVEASGVTAASEDVYVGTSATEAGMFFPVAGTGRLLLDPKRFEWYLGSLDGAAILYVRQG